MVWRVTVEKRIFSNSGLINGSVYIAHPTFEKPEYFVKNYSFRGVTYTGAFPFLNGTDEGVTWDQYNRFVDILFAQPGLLEQIEYEETTEIEQTEYEEETTEIEQHIIYTKYRREFEQKQELIEFIQSIAGKSVRRVIEELLRNPTMLLLVALHIGGNSNIKEEEIDRYNLPQESKEHIKLARALWLCKNPVTADPKKLRKIASSLDIDIPVEQMNPLLLCSEFKHAWQNVFSRPENFPSFNF
jgi:hypothetical protein